MSTELIVGACASAVTVLGAVKMFINARTKPTIIKYKVEQIEKALEIIEKTMEEKHKNVKDEIKHLSTKTEEFNIFRASTSAQLTAIQKTLESISAQLMQSSQLHVEGLRILKSLTIK